MTLPLLAVAEQQVDPSELERVIEWLRGRGWRRAKHIARMLDLNDRTLRAIASASHGRIISGQRGYCLIEEATVEEANHAAAWLEHQAKAMAKRACEIRRAMHQRQGSAA